MQALSVVIVWVKSYVFLTFIRVCVNVPMGFYVWTCMVHFVNGTVYNRLKALLFLPSLNILPRLFKLQTSHQTQEAYLQIGLCHSTSRICKNRSKSTPALIHFHNRFRLKYRKVPALQDQYQVPQDPITHKIKEHSRRCKVTV